LRLGNPDFHGRNEAKSCKSTGSYLAIVVICGHLPCVIADEAAPCGPMAGDSFSGGIYWDIGDSHEMLPGYRDDPFESTV